MKLTDGGWTTGELAVLIVVAAAVAIIVVAVAMNI